MKLILFLTAHFHCLLLRPKSQIPNSRFQKEHLGLWAWDLCFETFDSPMPLNGLHYFNTRETLH